MRVHTNELNYKQSVLCWLSTFCVISDFLHQNRNQFPGSRHLEKFAPNLSFNKTESETNDHWRTFAVTERTTLFMLCLIDKLPIYIINNHYNFLYCEILGL